MSGYNSLWNSSSTMSLEVLGDSVPLHSASRRGVMHRYTHRKKSKIGILLQKSKIWKYFGRGKPFPTFFEA